jgi:hypothetical protein
MGSLDDPKLWDLHNQLQMSLQQSSPPDWQKACQILNGMSMPDMLDELWRIKAASKLSPRIRVRRPFAPCKTPRSKKKGSKTFSPIDRPVVRTCKCNPM